MPFIQKDDTVILTLNCQLQDWSSPAWTEEAHLCSWTFVFYKEDFIITYKEGPLATKSHSTYNQSSIY